MARSILLEFRRDTAAHWTAANPVLAAGEPGYETDTNKLKIGDGVTAWAGLAYLGGAASLAVTDGTTSVPNVTTIDFVGGASVANAGGGQANVSASTGPGSEIGYAQITAPVNVVSTTEATPTTIISPGALTFDGGAVMVEFFSPFVTNPQVANGFVLILLFEGATEIARLADVGMTTSSTTFQSNLATVGRYRFTPTAGAHTYTVGAFCNSTTGTPKVGAGAGGTGAYAPAFVRFTRV